MRSTRLVSRTAAAAAVLALSLAACGGGDDGDTGSAGGGGTDAGTGVSAITITGTDALKFSPGSATLAAGEITFTLTSEGSVNHDIAIDGENGDEPIVVAAAGATETATYTLDAGTYTFYCSVPGHRAAGMEGTFTVA